MRPVVARSGASVAAIGLVVLVLGTFLPWLRSGTALRDSYQSVGALRELVAGALPDTLLTAWLFVIPVCGVCIALYALRLRRTAAAIGIVVSVMVAVVAVVVIVQGTDRNGLIGASAFGPAVTLVGAVAGAAGAIAVVAVPWGGQRTRGGSS